MANGDPEESPDQAWQPATSAAFGAAFQVARDLEARAIGADHLFAALAAGRPDGAARDVLGATGLDPDALRASVRAEPRPAEDSPDGPSSGPSSLSPNPRLNRVVGRAEGFAASRHGGPPGSVDLLLALLWDGDWRIRPS